MITTENSVVAIPPPASPTICPFSLNILLFKENLSEMQPCLDNGYLVSRHAGNNVSECSFLSSRFQRSKGVLQRKNMSVRCFHEHICYFTKLSKTL